jgi:polar amino acid transport system permease protein
MVVRILSRRYSSSRRPYAPCPCTVAWVDFFRAFPPLVLLILLFAGLPFAGLELGGFVCVTVAFFLNTGAYYGEILRAGIGSVPAVRSRPRAPPASPACRRWSTSCYPRRCATCCPTCPSTRSRWWKLTSLGSVVAVPELLYQARQAQSLTYNPTPIVPTSIVVAAIIYFLMLWPVVRLLSRLENRGLAGR